MVITLGRCQKMMTLLSQLYSNERYVENLKQIRSRMRDIYNRIEPQFDDIEAEITCLLLMHYQPKMIREFISISGWATMYLLNTLDVCALDESRIHSYCHHDHALNINDVMTPEMLKKWTMTKGHVNDELETFVIGTDYLFIDSDHSEKTAHKYVNVLEELLKKAKETQKPIVCSVHDVFHAVYDVNFEFSGESRIVIDFLRKNGIEYFSPRNFLNQKKITELRAQNGLDQIQVHNYTTNPAIFFVLS